MIPTRTKKDVRWWDNPLESELTPTMFWGMRDRYIGLFYASKDDWFLGKSLDMDGFGHTLSAIRSLETNEKPKAKRFKRRGWL